MTKWQKMKSRRMPKGLCVRCGKAPHEPRRVYCEPCLEQGRIRFRLRTGAKPRARRSAQDKRDYNRQRMRDTRMIRHMDGECIGCGKPKRALGRKSCSECLARRVVLRRRQKEKNDLLHAQKRMCTKCSIRKAVEGGRNCKRCRNREKAYRLKEAPAPVPLEELEKLPDVNPLAIRWLRDAINR